MVMPLLNEAVALEAGLKSFKALSVNEWICCDGGSTDATLELLQDRGISICQSGKGRALQMNAGAKHCQSDILLFIHADTELCEEHIQSIKELMQDDAVVGGHFDVRLSGPHWAFRIIEWFMNHRSCLTGISTGDQCLFVRREVFEAMGGFPEQALMEDVEFSKRLKRHGKVACLHQKVTTSSRRWEKHGIVKTIWLMWKLRFLYWLGTSPEKLSRMYRNVR